MIARRIAVGPAAAALAALAAALSLLGACGSDDATEGNVVEVLARDDLTFDQQAYEAEAGEITFVYRNVGSTHHTLLVRGIDDFKLSVGNRDEGTLELEAGTYELWCDVPGHEQAGMVATLEVSEAAGEPGDEPAG